MNFDVNLGQLFVTGGLMGVGWGLKQVEKSVKGFVSRVELHGDVINEHSEVLEDKGLTVRPFRRVK